VTKVLVAKFGLTRFRRQRLAREWGAPATAAWLAPAIGRFDVASLPRRFGTPWSGRLFNEPLSRRLFARDLFGVPSSLFGPSSWPGQCGAPRQYRARQPRRTIMRSIQIAIRTGYIIRARRC
jgi:hypothetical protein